MLLVLLDFFYYLNVNSNITIAKAEKNNHREIDNNRTQLDYIIQDDTVYYFSKKNSLWKTKGHLYKSKINSKKVEKVCDFNISNFTFGFIYKNKLYYKDTNYNVISNFNKEVYDRNYSVTIKTLNLNNCKIKDVFSYEYTTLEYSNNLQPNNNILDVYYTNNGEMFNSTKKITYDMDKEKIIKEYSDSEVNYDRCYEIKGKIYFHNNVIYQVEGDLSIHILNSNDNYIYYYTKYEEDNYVYKLDIKNKSIVNKEKLDGHDIENYDENYFYIDNKLYKYDYTTDKLEVVLKKMDEEVESAELHVINSKYVFVFLDDSISYAGDKQTFGSKMFIYDENNKILFKENQDEYTNTLRDIIIENNNIYVIYSNGFVKKLDLSKM